MVRASSCISVEKQKTYQYVYLDLEPPLRGDLYKEGKEPNKEKGILMLDLPNDVGHKTLMMSG
jgi:hypothetical protein